MMRSSRLSSIVLLVLLCVTFTLASGLDLNGPKPKTTIRSFAPCPKACSNNGLCEKGVCVCQSGFSGPDCSQICPSLCSNHGQCVNGKCICTPGYAGEDCSIAAGCPRSLTDHPEVECSGHGVCHRPSQTCICRQGYVGKDCSIDDGSCGSAHCSNRGHCQSGQCHCDLGYSGEHCEVKSVCPNDCNGTGHCIGGTCHCFPGWSGIDCKTKDAQVCPGKNGGCSGNGICANGKCICSPGYAGESCAKLVDVGLQPFCAGGNNCTGNGVCANNQCFCRPGFYGAKCEKSGCPNGCGEHGHCSVGICRCQPGWGGPDCQTKTTCLNGCSGHGLCNKGQCSCEPYWTGADCSKSTLPTLACPKSNGLECGGVGQCFLGQCFCEPSFTGADCGTVVQNCPSNCGGPSRGTCRFGSCFCEPGFDGPGCEHTKTCAPSCEQHGICLKGECKCALGWTGADCDKRVSSVLRQADVERDLLNSVVAMSLNTPPVPRAICSSIGRPCSEHGLCVAGACVCEPGWGGQDCGLVLNGADSATCGTLGCGPNGQCAFGTCICQPGYSGRQCDKPVFLPCPNDCSSHGICYLGTCDCHPGFEGDDCSRVKPCENGCVRGACVQGNCECVHGWRGLNCSEEISQSELPEKSYLTPVGLNTCGLSGCGTHGVCVGGQCVCVEGYAGTLCELPLLGYTPRPASDVTPANPAVSDVFGSDSCTVNCGLHGVCIGGTCTCVDGWAGKKCTKSVPEVQSHAMFGAKSDFLSIMTLQKRAYLSKLPSKPAQLVPQANISFMESHSAADTTDDDDTPIQPKIFRNTAILSHDSAASAGSTDKLSYSPDTAQSIGADAVVPSSASNQVEINNAIANHPSETTYSMSMNPYLMSFLCFLTGVLVTITLKCLLDKRDQEKRKMQKMEELLQPAS